MVPAACAGPIRAMGTDNIETIVRNYDGPAFGFASRNFYVSFLAAEEVERNAEQYFGLVRRDAPERATIDRGACLPQYRHTGTDARACPARPCRPTTPRSCPPIWSGKKYVPRGFTAAAARQHAPIRGGLPAGGRSRRASGRSRSSATAAGIAPGPHGRNPVRHRRPLWHVASRMASLNGLSKHNLIRVGPGAEIAGRDPRRRAAAGRPRGWQARPTSSAAATTWPLISRRTGVPQRQLMAINSIDDPNRIFPGQRLRLTSGSEGGG